MQLLEDLCSTSRAQSLSNLDFPQGKAEPLSLESLIVLFRNKQGKEQRSGERQELHIRSAGWPDLGPG